MRPLVLAISGRGSRSEWGDAEVVTVSSAEVPAMASKLIADGATRLGVEGADADVARVAAAAHEAGRRVALALTAGTDLAAMFAQSPADSARRLREGSRYRIDLGFANGSWGSRPFLNAVACGMPAGRFGLSPFSPVRRGTVRVAGDTRPLEFERAVGLFIMNGQTWNGMTVAPKATPVDGKLDLQVVTSARRRIPAMRSSLLRGLHLTRPDVTRRRVTHARVGVPPRWLVAADGERLGRGPFTVTMAAGAVEILV